MNFHKKDLLNTLGNRTEEHIKIAVSNYQNQPEEVLLRPSVSGGWSIAQCLDHLNGYGDYYLPQLRKVLREEEKDETLIFRSGWLGDYFTKMMEPSAKKYKAFKGHVPQKDLNAFSVVAKFINQQEELLLLLGRAGDCNLRRRVPVSVLPLIRLQAGDVFRFLIAHNERHMRQAFRNLQNSVPRGINSGS